MMCRTFQVCYQLGNQSFFVCPTPKITLPPEVEEYRKSENSSAGIILNDPNALNFSLGIMLDGLEKFEDLTKEPNTERYSHLTVYVDPTFSKDDNIRTFRPFWPIKNRILQIKVWLLNCGFINLCIVVEYITHLGNDLPSYYQLPKIHREAQGGHLLYFTIPYPLESWLVYRSQESTSTLNTDKIYIKFKPFSPRTSQKQAIH